MGIVTPFEHQKTTPPDSSFPEEQKLPRKIGRSSPFKKGKQNGVQDGPNYVDSSCEEQLSRCSAYLQAGESPAWARTPVWSFATLEQVGRRQARRASRG